MSARTHTISNAFVDALYATGPSPDRAGKMDLYGWLVGSWDLDVTEFRDDGSKLRRPGEWHFAWALEGRAIQDVWIVPPRGAQRAGDAAANANYYGSTLRVYDPILDAWHIRWNDPVSQHHFAMVGRKHGDGILQEGKGPGGLLIRWSFTEIEPNSLRWRSELSADGGANWRCNMDFRARRRSIA